MRVKQICEAEMVTGFHGFLLDFIQVKREQFASCLDLAGKSKLFGIVVDTLETANKVLEINKSVKGPVINIFCLELQRDFAKIAIPQNCKALVDFIEIKKKP